MFLAVGLPTVFPLINAAADYYEIQILDSDFNEGEGAFTK